MANSTQSSIDIPADLEPAMLRRTAEKAIIDTALKGLKRQMAKVTR